jgi:hypothetical protein
MPALETIELTKESKLGSRKTGSHRTMDSLDLHVRPGGVLPVLVPNGAWNSGQAIHLLDHGIVATPDYWRLWEDLRFIYYWDLNNSRGQAERSASAVNAQRAALDARVWDRKARLTFGCCYKKRRKVGG